MSTRTFTFNVTAASSVPSWWAGIPVGQWTAVSQNTLSNVVEPARQAEYQAAGYNSVATYFSYGGPVYDPVRKEILAVAAGGHGDYPSNGAYAFSLATGTWKRLADDSPRANWKQTLTASDQVAIHNDGRPQSVHTYQAIQYANGRVWVTMQSAGACNFTKSSDSTYGVFSWSRDDASALGADTTPIAYNAANPLPYRTHGAVAMSSGTNAEMPVSGYDSVTGKIWTVNGKTADYRVFSTDTNPGVTESARNSTTLIDQSMTLPAGGAYLRGWAVAIPDKRIMLVAPNTVGNGELAILSLDATSQIGKAPGQAGAWVKRTTGPTNLCNWNSSGTYGQTGAVYVDGAVWFCEPYTLGSTLRKLTIPADINGSWASAWTTVSTTGATLPGRNVGAGRQFGGVADMGDGKPALYYVSGATGAVYFYKIR